MVERETGDKWKRLRTDNGGEYTSAEFEEYYAKYGIRHEKTVPGTPQHNGVAERMNRTITEKVRCMLKMANLPKSFWGEEVNIVVYLINRSPAVPLDFDNPEVVWTGKEVSHSHLKVFGCKSFMHVPREERLKLDDEAIPCIFVGYGNEEYGYRFWNPVERKVIRNRDVGFHAHEILPNEESGGAVKSTKKLAELRIVHSPVHVTGGGDTEEVDDAGDFDQGKPTPTMSDIGHQPRRSPRERIPSTRYPTSEYSFITDEGEPENFQDEQSDKDCWIKAIQAEISSR